MRMSTFECKECIIIFLRFVRKRFSAWCTSSLGADAALQGRVLFIKRVPHLSDGHDKQNKLERMKMDTNNFDQLTYLIYYIEFMYCNTV